MLNKLIVVINGKGGVGKDTLCDSISKKYNVMNVSAIDPIKKIAREHGWNGEKDDKSRCFLAELKRTFAKYNDLPTEYLKGKTIEFFNSNNEVLFVHIREADQIEHYKQAIYPQKCVTLLITRATFDNNHLFGNAADDYVDNYEYDFVFQNDMSIEESATAFCSFIESLRLI